MAVLAPGRHVADVVPSGQIQRLRKTIDVLADNNLVRDLHAEVEDLCAGRTIVAHELAADMRLEALTNGPSPRGHSV